MNKYPRIDLTVDAVIFSTANDMTEVLLIQRKHEPFAGHWAIPGGFVDQNENLEDAAKRELQEETGLVIPHLKQLYAFGNPKRDPRKRIVSIAFYASLNKDDYDIEAADDAADVKWFSIEHLPPLAFDHSEILDKAIKKIAPEQD